MKVRLSKDDVIDKRVYLDGVSQEILKMLPKWLCSNKRERKIAASMAAGEFEFSKFVLEFAIKVGLVEVERC